MAKVTDNKESKRKEPEADGQTMIDGGPPFTIRITGFTLAELLIALAILGVIAIFTIPKVLQSEQNQKYNAIIKESASIVSDAYNASKQANSPNVNAQPYTFIEPYLSYIKIDSASIIDGSPTTGNIDCSTGGGTKCYLLASGAILFTGGCQFGSNGELNAIIFHVDPDGKLGGAKSVRLFLYYNGRITSYANVLNGTVGSAGCGPYAPNASLDPSWFNWN